MRCWFGSGWNGRLKYQFEVWALLQWAFKSCSERKDWPQWVHWGGCRAPCSFTLCAASVCYIKPWFDTNISFGQRAKHWDAKDKSSSEALGADIFSRISELIKLLEQETHVVSSEVLYCQTPEHYTSIAMKESRVWESVIEDCGLTSIWNSVNDWQVVFI